MHKYLLIIQKYLLIIVVGLGLSASAVYFALAKPVAAAQPVQSNAVFDSQGKLKLPDPHTFRRWVFVGAPLTPNALNNGKASFPEYHHVYIEQKNVDAYLKTGEFPEGTVIVKELTRVLNPTIRDGSAGERRCYTLLIIDDRRSDTCPTRCRSGGIGGCQAARS
jgi:hypothetical protein